MDITQFSTHLFWDVNRDDIDIEKHKVWLINRVLDYGVWSDWLIIKNHYGIQKIAEIAVTLRDLSSESIALISILSGIPKEKFRCYVIRQSTPIYWDF